MTNTEKLSRFIIIFGLVQFMIAPAIGIFMEVNSVELWQAKVYYSIRGIGFMIIGFTLPKIFSRSR